MLSTQWVSHVATVHGRPALRIVFASRCLSSSRTAAVTSARVLRSTWRRPGVPSSRMPTVTRRCHFPSLFDGDPAVVIAALEASGL